MKTAKEILTERSLIPKGASVHDNSIVLFKEALEAMEEYHAQFKSKPNDSPRQESVDDYDKAVIAEIGSKVEKYNPADEDTSHSQVM